MIDAGVNLCSKQFNNYHDTLIEHAKEAGLNGFITISNSHKEWKQNLNLIRQYSNDQFKIYMTIGIHPHNAKEVTTDNVYDELTQLVQSNSCIVAIGECGLDYDRNFSPKSKQIEVFKKHIELSLLLNKPLYLHERDAHDDFYNTLLEYKNNCANLKGIVHCFTGKKEHMMKYIELGLYIGITGWICDKRRNHDLVEAVKDLDLNKLILETDAPWLIPFEYSKHWNTKRNQPDAIYYVSSVLSNILEISEESIINKSSQNISKLFSL